MEFLKSKDDMISGYIKNINKHNIRITLMYNKQTLIKDGYIYPVIYNSNRDINILNITSINMNSSKGKGFSVILEAYYGEDEINLNNIIIVADINKEKILITTESSSIVDNVNIDYVVADVENNNKFYFNLDIKNVKHNVIEEIAIEESLKQSNVATNNINEICDQIFMNKNENEIIEPNPDILNIEQIKRKIFSKTLINELNKIKSGDFSEKIGDLPLLNNNEKITFFKISERYLAESKSWPMMMILDILTQIKVPLIKKYISIGYKVDSKKDQYTIIFAIPYYKDKLSKCNVESIDNIRIISSINDSNIEYLLYTHIV